MAWVKCSVCGFLQSATVADSGPNHRCSTCRRPFEFRIFPAIQKSATPEAPPPLPEDPPGPGEAVCFYSPSRRATQSCSHCGVFISDAWAAQWGNETVCLKCLGDLRQKGGSQQFEVSRTLWDNIAYTLSLAPIAVGTLLLMTVIGMSFGILAYMMTAITAPIAIFLSLRYWNAPRSLVPRGRRRLWVAIILSVVQLLAWIGFIIAIVVAIRNEV